MTGGVKLSNITLEYLSNLFQSSQKLPQTSDKQSGDRSLEEIASLFDNTGTSLPRRIEPGMKPKTIKDIKANLQKDFGKYHNNLPLAMLSVGGELLEYAGQHATYLLGNIEGGIETARAASYPFVVASDKVKEISAALARNLLTKEQYNSVADWYNSLPSGTKIVASSMSDGIILYGGGSALSLATKPLLKSKLPLYKAVELEPQPSLAKFEHFALAESSINVIIDDIIGNEKIISGSRRELAALEVKTACKELISQNGTIIAGGQHIVPIKDIKRLVNTYGGNEAHWVKMTSKAAELSFKDRSVVVTEYGVLSSKTNMQLHWYENINTGKKVEFKPVIKTKK
jgi:hypothetical protein